jgi:hypothetical protein
LIGGDSPQDPLDVLVNDAPRWRRTIEPAVGVFPDRPVWEGVPTPDQRLVMVRRRVLFNCVCVCVVTHARVYAMVVVRGVFVGAL